MLDERKALRSGRSLAIIALLVLAVFVPTAAATNRHLFDPALSLRGSCLTSTTDPVPDPGCPYPGPDAGGPRAFENPCGTAVDRYGDIYVVSAINGGLKAKEGWIDIFDAEGRYLSRIDIGEQSNPCSVAVDSAGNIYVSLVDAQVIERYEPEVFPPNASSEYSSPSVVFEQCASTITCNVAIDPSNDHLFVASATHITELSSALEGNGVVDETWGAGVGTELSDVDVCGKTNDVYASGIPAGIPFNEAVKMPRVFVFAGNDGHTKAVIKGTGEEEFGFVFGMAGIAVDQLSCDVYVDDTEPHHVVDQFGIGGAFPPGAEFIGQLPKPPKLKSPAPFAALAVDDPMESGEGAYHSPNEGYVYVTSGLGTSEEPHLFAFRPSETGPPLIKAQKATEIGETEAVLQAELNANGLATTYHFEYVTQADFKTSQYANAVSAPVPSASGGEGGSYEPVSVAISRLLPDTAYRVRLVATNEECTTIGEGEGCGEGSDATFSTYPAPLSSPPCLNSSLRTGPSASLPDCRAYELVTPPDTNGRVPTMTEFGGTIYGVSVETEPGSPDGEGLIFGTEGGSLPGLPGSGYHDAYEARRDPVQGWRTDFAGMTGPQASEPTPGGFTADPRFSFWEAKGNGSLAGTQVGVGYHYIHRPGGVLDPACSPEPDSGFEWIGCGSLGHDTIAYGKLISPDGDHTIFSTVGGQKTQLEPCAAPSGTTAIYDRTADGVTHCVSVKPDGGSFGAGEEATYLGASADGTAVAFKAGGTLYVSIDDEETVEVTAGSALFGGLSQHGDRIFYLRPNLTQPKLPGTDIPRGELFACDVRSGPCAGPQKAQDPTQIGSGEESILVNVSADGSHAYFISPRRLDEEEEGTPGANNLYVWDGVGIHLVAAVETADVVGEPAFPGTESEAGGLGLWITHAVAARQQNAVGPAVDPSRSTADGQAFVFESRADLTAYKSGGQREIYRYEAAGGGLICISCNPTGEAAVSDAKLESNIAIPLASSLPPVTALTHIPNIDPSGQRAFFQSGDRLVAGDVDGKIDVYEWKAQGVGGCARPDGCLALISSGNSTGDDYLYAMTPDGHDVFIESSDLLTSQDHDGTPSIYDARVDGGFAEEQTPAACQGDACQGAPGAAPALPAAVNTLVENPNSNRRCPKGKRLAKGKHGSRCVAKHKKHSRHKRHRQAGKGAAR